MVETELELFDDLLKLGDFSVESCLETIRRRFQEYDQVFTQIGAPILISINPYRSMLDLFTVAQANLCREYSLHLRGLSKNKKHEITNPGPHLFMIAEDCFQSLRSEHKNQSIIITGESGAGKTEACKTMLSYIAKAGDKVFQGDPSDFIYVPGNATQANTGSKSGEAGIEGLVLDSSPLLEAFGNAKTVRNINSSRFGKFIQIDIQAETGKIVQGRINSYLLEKTRVTRVSPGERSFHIFYQFLANKDLRDKFGLPKADPEYYGFLKGGQHKIEGIDDST